ncbi:MAG: hypothetical protein HYX39_13570 [Bacteroidetes bacterium]|nr:hypothetical protein [Bacteroidota bacterium]
MKKLIIVFITLLFAQANTIMAQKPGVVVSKKEGWHKIGEVKANFKMEKESIVVIGADKFKAVKLMVKEAPINILAMQVFYEGGTSDEIKVENEVKAGETTKDFNVKEIAIKKVSFTYKTQPNSKHDRAHVELWGLK